MYLRLLRILLTTRRGTIRLWEPVQTRFRVRVSDLDLRRHMNNGTYLTIADLGRVDLMLRSGFWREMKRRGWYPVVAAQTINYRRSLAWRSRFVVTTRLLGADQRSVYVEQTFTVDGVLHAQAVIRARFLKRAGGAVSMAELEAAVGGFPDGFEAPEWVDDWASASLSAVVDA